MPAVTTDYPVEYTVLLRFKKKFCHLYPYLGLFSLYQPPDFSRLRRLRFHAGRFLLLQPGHKAFSPKQYPPANSYMRDYLSPG
jgi:hypothetical protein